MSNIKESENIQTIRHFHRFYTRWLGLLREKLDETPFSLTEMRVLFELYYRSKTCSTKLCRDLYLDAGYLSRILRNFQKKGFVEVAKNAKDRRQSDLMLTTNGKNLFSSLEDEQNKKIEILLKNLSSQKQIELVKAMKIIESLLEDKTERTSSYFLRSHRPGDLGWVVHRHGVLYNKEYKYNEKFEAMVADIAAKFLQNYNPTCEHCWIVEKDGELVGSILIAKKSKNEGMLRLFLIEPQARGNGLGKKLLEECLCFAKKVGYKKISLITHSELGAARHLYEQAGFVRIKQTPYQNWGRDNLIEETWEIKLS